MNATASLDSSPAPGSSFSPLAAADSGSSLYAVLAITSVAFGATAYRTWAKRPNRVEINNEISHNYTVIDIFAHDHVGLLYKISHTLADLGLYIDVSKISTKVDQAADTFYVKDIFGSKVRDERKIEEVKEQLLDCLDEEL